MSSVGDYLLKEELGRGAFGIVYMAINVKTNTNHAIKKVLKPTDFDNRNMLRNELLANLLLDHPNILKCYSMFSEGDYIYMVLELANKDKGSLSSFIREIYVKESELKIMARSLLSAVQYCHSIRICHGDIKPNNILIINESKDSDNIYKLADFGAAKDNDDDKTLPITNICSAPETFYKDHKLLPASDMWSVGVVIYFLFTATYPFIEKDIEVSMHNARNGKYLDKNDRLISNTALDLIKKLIVMDPDKRLTATEALNHPWLR